MAVIELILLQRVEKLGQMGDVVRVKPGYARNYLLPQKKALRANKNSLAQFEGQHAQLEAQNIKRREEAERVAERMGGLSVVILRQAGESGSLYGSVSARDISDAVTAAGLTANRTQIVLTTPIKSLGLSTVRLVLHPEVDMEVTVNVARSVEEAEKQARGEQVGLAGEEDVEPDEELEFGAALAEVGRRVLPHCTAVGKVLLSTTPAPEVHDLLVRTGMPRYTDHTLTDEASFDAELDRTRERGYAVDEGEQEVGVRCVAVAVPQVGPRPGARLAVSISGPAPRMTDELLAEAVPALHRAAAAIADDLA